MCKIWVDGEYIELNEKFCENFSIEELKVLIEHASIVSNDVIIYDNGRYFIEISADLYDHLDVSVTDMEKQKGVKMSKEEVMRIVRQGKGEEYKVLEIGE